MSESIYTCSNDCPYELCGNRVCEPREERDVAFVRKTATTFTAATGFAAPS